MKAQQIKNIWENCPKAKDKMVNWLKVQLNKKSGVPEIDAHIKQAIDNAELALRASLQASPRFLYEFFDENEVYLTVGRWKDNWLYSFDKTDKGNWEGNGDSRIEIEDEAFFEAFHLLERKLNG